MCPVKAGMFSREQTCRGRSQSPVVWIAEEMETEPLKPIDKTSSREVTSHRAVTTVNALCSAYTQRHTRALSKPVDLLASSRLCRGVEPSNFSAMIARMLLSGKTPRPAKPKERITRENHWRHGFPHAVDRWELGDHALADERKTDLRPRLSSLSSRCISGLGANLGRDLGRKPRSEARRRAVPLSLAQALPGARTALAEYRPRGQCCHPNCHPMRWDRPGQAIINWKP